MHSLLRISRHQPPRNGFGSNKGHEERVSIPKNVWAYRYFEIENGEKSVAAGPLSEPERNTQPAARGNTQPSICASANAEINNHECPTMRGLIDRYIDQVPVSRCAGWRRAGRRFRHLLSLCDVLQARARQVGVPDGRRIGCRTSRNPAVRAAVEEWLRSLWRSPKNPIQQRLVAFVNEEANRYLTQIRFLDSRQVQGKNGSSGRTRINNETYFQEHTGPPMTPRANRSSPPADKQSANGAHGFPADIYRTRNRLLTDDWVDPAILSNFALLRRI